MASLRELVEVVACPGLEASYVTFIGRKLREAGLITAGKPGRSVKTRLNTRDAANLLIGVNASDTGQDAPQTVRVYRDLRVSSAEGDALQAVTGARAFGNFLECTLDAIVAGKFREFATKLGKEAVPDGDSIETRIQFTQPHPQVAVQITRVHRRAADRLPFDRSKIFAADFTVHARQLGKRELTERMVAHGVDRAVMVGISNKTLERVAAALQAE